MALAALSGDVIPDDIGSPASEAEITDSTSKSAITTCKEDEVQSQMKVKVKVFKRYMTCDLHRRMNRTLYPTKQEKFSPSV